MAQVQTRSYLTIEPNDVLRFVFVNTVMVAIDVQDM